MVSPSVSGCSAGWRALGLFFDMVIATVTVTWKNGIVSSAAGVGL